MKKQESQESEFDSHVRSIVTACFYCMRALSISAAGRRCQWNDNDLSHILGGGLRTYSMSIPVVHVGRTGMQYKVT